MTPEDRAEAARILGSVRSEAKRAAAKRRPPPPPPPMTRVCECNRTDGTHAARCPVYLREWRRARRARERGE